MIGKASCSIMSGARSFGESFSSRSITAWFSASTRSTPTRRIVAGVDRFRAATALRRVSLRARADLITLIARARGRRHQERQRISGPGSGRWSATGPRRLARCLRLPPRCPTSDRRCQTAAAGTQEGRETSVINHHIAFLACIAFSPLNENRAGGSMPSALRTPNHPSGGTSISPRADRNGPAAGMKISRWPNRRASIE